MQRATHSYKRRKSRRVLPLIFIFLLLAAAGGAAAYYEYGAKKQPLIPPSVKTKSSVKLLYPYQLPTGYAVVNSSFSVTSDKVLYYAADNTGNRLNFTVQVRPQNFDFEKFYTQVLSNTTKFTTPLGEGAVGTTNGILMGSLATTSSWAIVTGNSNKVSGDTIQQALKGLKFASY